MTRAEKKQSPSSSPITSLPEDVVVDILARVPRCDYPRVSLVSKHFRSLVSSAEIYARRSSLGFTEHCLYVVLFNWDDCVDRLYTLRRNSSSNRLVLIPGLPAMPRFGSFVAVGSRIYAFGGMIRTSSAFFIDCSTSHTVQPLPRMPAPMSDTVADIIGRRIYVFGCIDTDQRSYAMVVFDTETQTWEGPMTTGPGMQQIRNGRLVVMSGKIYLRDSQKSFVYDPKECKWETEEMLNSKFWEDACVVDDVLYFYGDFYKKLRAYDPEHKCWHVVKGLDDFKMGRGWFQTVNCGGRLVLFYGKGESVCLTEEICCAEISLERRKGGQIWGRVDQWRSDHAVIAGNFYIMKSLDVVL